MCVWLYFFFNICFGRKLLDFCKEVCRAMLECWFRWGLFIDLDVELMCVKCWVMPYTPIFLSIWLKCVEWWYRLGDLPEVLVDCVLMHICWWCCGRMGGLDSFVGLGVGIPWGVWTCSLVVEMFRRGWCCSGWLRAGGGLTLAALSLRRGRSGALSTGLD